MSDNRNEFLDNWRKIRKPMPPSSKVIKPKIDEEDKFNWRDIDEDDGDDYKSISEERGY